MTKVDPALQRVFDKFEPLLGDWEQLTKALQEATLDEIQIMIENWEWTEFPTSLRLFREAEERKIPEEFQQRYTERNRKLAATYPPLRKDLPELEPMRKPVTPGRPSTSKPKEEQVAESQPADALDQPSWWQEHKNQVYVGLIVGIPGLIVGILAAIYGG